MAATKTANDHCDSFQSRNLTNEDDFPVRAIGKNLKEQKVKKLIWRDFFKVLFGLFFKPPKLWIYESPDRPPKEFEAHYEARILGNIDRNF